MKRLIAGLFLLTAFLQAEPRTFTDQFGRSIMAELLSVEADQVRIRREDGQVFQLAISKLTEADQKFIKDWSEKSSSGSKPAEIEKTTPDPAKIIVGISRGKFASRTIAKYVDYTHKHEDWGYSIQLTNQHLHSVTGFRVEYNLFSRKFSDTSSPSVIPGSKKIDLIKSRGSEVFRTSTAEVCKTRDSYFGINSQGEMRGIWLRVYADGQLLIEQSSPESLMTTEKWTKVEDAE